MKTDPTKLCLKSEHCQNLDQKMTYFFRFFKIPKNKMKNSNFKSKRFKVNFRAFYALSSQIKKVVSLKSCKESNLDTLEPIKWKQTPRNFAWSQKTSKISTKKWHIFWAFSKSPKTRWKIRISSLSASKSIFVRSMRFLHK